MTYEEACNAIPNGYYQHYDDLALCPNCGGAVACACYLWNREERYCCECTECCQILTEMYKTEQEAVDAWNAMIFSSWED